MKKAKKTKAKKTKAAERETALDRLAAQLRAALRRESANFIEIGKLLIEIRKHVPRGDWKTWPVKNANMSYRTALNYIDAAEYVERKKCNRCTFRFREFVPNRALRTGGGGAV